jgi:hypothetical protein
LNRIKVYEDGKEYRGTAKRFVSHYYGYMEDNYQLEKSKTFLSDLLSSAKEKIALLERENKALHKNHPDRLLRQYCKHLQEFINRSVKL